MHYRVYYLTIDKHICGSRVIQAEDDADATNIVTQDIDRRAKELWAGGRLVGSFPDRSTEAACDEQSHVSG